MGGNQAGGRWSVRLGAVRWEPGLATLVWFVPVIDIAACRLAAAVLRAVLRTLPAAGSS